jgi:hypothetical protein
LLFLVLYSRSASVFRPLQPHLAPDSSFPRLFSENPDQEINVMEDFAMNTPNTAANEDAFCSLLDRGIDWLEQMDTRLKGRAVDLDHRDQANAEHSQQLDQRESLCAERERHNASVEGSLNEHAARLSEREGVLRNQEEAARMEREENRDLRTRLENKMRDLSETEARLQSRDEELRARRRSIELCEAAITRFQQAFEKMLVTPQDLASGQVGVPRSVPASLVAFPGGFTHGQESNIGLTNGNTGLGSSSWGVAEMAR